MPQQMESSKVYQEIEEDKKTEENRSKDDEKSLQLDEAGKKDPLTRRKELLIVGGLAEVCLFLSLLITLKTAWKRKCVLKCLSIFT